MYLSQDTEYKALKHDDVLYKNYSDCEASHQPKDKDYGKDTSLNNNLNNLTNYSYCRCSKNYIDIISALQSKNSKVINENFALRKEIMLLKQQSKILNNMCKLNNN